MAQNMGTLQARTLVVIAPWPVAYATVAGSAVKCLGIVSLYPAGVLWTTYVSFLYFALGTPPDGQFRGQPAPGGVYTLLIKTGSPSCLVT